jgi:predicted dehydrogenase
MTLVFPSGACAHIHISWLDPHKVRRMTVVGSKKMAAYDDVSPDARITVYDRGVDRVPTADSPRDFKTFADFQLRLRSGDVTIPALPFPEPLQAECQHFIECIQAGMRPLTDGRHGVAVVRILEAAQQSIQRGGAAIPVR